MSTEPTIPHVHVSGVRSCSDCVWNAGHSCQSSGYVGAWIRRWAPANQRGSGPVWDADEACPHGLSEAAADEALRPSDFNRRNR